MTSAIIRGLIFDLILSVVLWRADLGWVLTLTIVICYVGAILTARQHERRKLTTS